MATKAKNETTAPPKSVPARGKVQPKPQKSRAERREELAVKLRNSNLTVDEKRAVVRKFNAGEG